jgi:uncharacterized membrane protein required for colicin V production
LFSGLSSQEKKAAVRLEALSRIVGYLIHEIKAVLVFDTVLRIILQIATSLQAPVGPPSGYA